MMRRLSRRAVLAAFAAGSLGARPIRLAAQAPPDEVSEADLERFSQNRMIRVGSLATGVVTTLPLEVYVARVLTAESDPRAPDAAREALAIAIRTYTLTEIRHRADGFDICDTTHCQVLRPSNPATRRLTLNTSLQILTHEGRPARLYYSASCGGYSERAGDAWPGVADHPYLQVRSDDVHDDEVPWTFDLSFGEAQALLRRLGYVGQLNGVTVDARSTSGRAALLRLAGMEPGFIGGDQFRMAVGATRLRSTAFQVVTDGAVLRFIGRGYGHGVGMCVIGAGKRAQRGESAAAILAQYYPGLALIRLPLVVAAR